MAGYMLAVTFIILFTGMIDNRVYGQECPECRADNTSIICYDALHWPCQFIEEGTTRFVLSRSQDIDHIPPQYFSNSQELRTIDLSENGITSLPEFTFVNLSRLHLIDLRWNSITTLEKNCFFNLPYITYCYLSHNQISSVAAGVFSDIWGIEILTLLGNRLTKVDSEMFSNLEYLREITLSANRISSLEAFSFANLPDVVYIYLISNLIKTLKASTFTNLPKVARINLDYNRIDTIEQSAFTNLPSLRYLHISHNNLQVLQSYTFTNVPSLFSIDLRWNSITNIEDSAFFNARSLRTIKLSSNNMLSFGSSLKNLRFFAVLSLSSNNIESLSNFSFSSQPSLTDIILDYNNIKTLMKSTFSDHSRLDSIYLNNNNIATLQANCFENLPSLSYIGLNDNDLRKLERLSFAKLPSLNAIRLTNNQLSYFDDNTFDDLPSLDYLFLDDNNITTLHLESFSYLPSLRFIMLQNNPIVCNGSIHWLKTWLQMNNGHIIYANCNETTTVTEFLEQQPFYSEGNVTYVDNEENDENTDHPSSHIYPPVSLSFNKEEYIFEASCGRQSIRVSRNIKHNRETTFRVDFESMTASLEDFTIVDRYVTFEADELDVDINFLFHDNYDRAITGTSLQLILVPEDITVIGTTVTVTILNNKDTLDWESDYSYGSGSFQGGDGGNDDNFVLSYSNVQPIFLSFEKEQYHFNSQCGGHTILICRNIKARRSTSFKINSVLTTAASDDFTITQKYFTIDERDSVMKIHVLLKTNGIKTGKERTFKLALLTEDQATVGATINITIVNNKDACSEVDQQT